MVCIVFPFIWPSDTEAKGAHTKWRKWGVPASPPRRDCDEPPDAPPVGSLTARRQNYRIRSKHAIVALQKERVNESAPGDNR
jgi:hypothetical protein